jgi:probable rRNA maturation factor
MEPPDPDGPASEIIVTDRRWRRLAPQAERIAARALRAAGVAPVTLVLDSDRAVRRLNWRFRGKNKPTNVLSFEAPAGAPGGDIILAFGVVRREARAARKRPAHHLAHLVVHAALHLQGFDHVHAGDARRMEMREIRVLHRIRVPNPWRTP